MKRGGEGSKERAAVDYVTAGDVAKLLGLSVGRVRQLAIDGTLVEAFRAGGHRLYDRHVVETYARTRAKAKARAKARRR